MENIKKTAKKCLRTMGVLPSGKTIPVLTSEDGFSYQIFEKKDTQDKYIRINGINSECDVLTIPEKISGIAVEVIKKSAFQGNAKLVQVKIPEGIRVIGAEAFKDCINLEMVELPPELKVINRACFQGCSALKAISIPYGVENLCQDAFDGCKMLDGLKLPEKLSHIGKNAFDNSLTKEGNMMVKKVASVQKTVPVVVSEKQTLQERKNDTYTYEVLSNEKKKTKYIRINGVTDNVEKNLIVPEQIDGLPVEIIAKGALENNDKIERVILPSSIRLVGANAFRNCSNLTFVELPSELDTLKSSTFANCQKLRTVILPYELKSIGSFAFAHCNNLAPLELPSSVTYIGRSAFNNNYRRVGNIIWKEKLDTIQLETSEQLSINHRIESLLPKYEYKAPSYDLKPLKNIDRLKDYSKKASRYFEKNGLWTSKGTEKKEITILLTGDLLCQENMIEAFKSTKGGYDFNLCFDHLRPILKSADLSIGNLETPISETAPYRGEILTHEGPFYCNAPIEYLEALQYAGFDMLTTANNHCLDAGARGLLETISNIKALGFIQTGTFVEQEDKFVIVDVCGFKIGITAFSVTYNTMDSNLTKAGKVTLLNHYSKENAHKIYTKMKNKGAEFVICCPHWGREFTNILSNKQMQMAEELSEMGYDFIAGSHSHVVQKFQYINNTPVIFSLGNLITHMNNMGKSAQDTQYPVIGALKLARKNNQIESNIKFIPCRILKNENKIPFQVIPITSHLRYDALATPLKDVPAKIANLLEVNLDSLETNFPITADAVKHFKTAKELQEDRSTKLIPMVKHNGTSRKIYKDISQNPEENIVHDAVGTYKIHQNFAELIAIDSNASVIRLNKEIKNIPLKRICLPQVKNATTRVVYIGAFTEYISAYSFKNYTKLESIRLFNNLKEIGNNAFENCSAMMGIILPVSLEVLGNEAFKNCGNLLSIKIPTTVKKIGQDAFVGCNKLIIYCEENSYAHEYAKANNIRVKFMPLPRIKNAKYEMIPSKTLSIKEGFHPQITIKEIYDTLAADISTYTGNFSIDEQVYNIVIRNEDLHEDCVAVIDEGQPDSIIKIQNAINSHVALIITTKQIDGIPCLVVKKPRQAYRKLISYIKSKYDLYTVAVTGSIGKTTCTAIIKNVMKEKYNVLDVRGNYNTYKTIGLCVQKLTPAHTAYVQEMHGASIGHGAKNAAMIQPNIGVITNIGASHLEQVGGTIEDVLREKLGIIKGLKEGGKLFINNDNKYLQNIKVPVTLVTYAVYNENSDYYAQNIVEYGDRTEFQIVCQKGIFNACVFSPGIHNVGNAIVAFAIGCDAGIDPEKILSAISKVETTGIRQNIVNRGGKTLYIDCYNANPESTAGAMKTLKKLSTGITGRHIAVVGDIAELGDESPKWHAYLAEKAYEAGMDCLVTFGRDTLHTHQRALELGIEAYHFSFEQRDDMEKWLSAQVHEGDCVLFKGSRICALEHSIKRVFPPNKSAKKEKI